MILRRGIFLFTFVIIVFQCAVAQKPEVKSVDKPSGHSQETITVKGSFFGTDVTKVAVTFGASKGDVISTTDQILEVKVPSGSTYDNIRVTNLRNG